MRAPKNLNSAKFLPKLVILSLAATLVAFAQAPGQTPELKLNEPLERELSAGQTHDYQVILKAAEFMQVRVEQKGIDVVLSIHSADGKQLAEMDSPNENEGFEILSFIAVSAGNYVIKIKRLEGSNSRSGSYNIALAVRRTPTELDRKRIQAEKQFLRATQIQIEKTEDFQPKIEKYQELVAVWKDLGDSYVMGLIEETITELQKQKGQTEASARQAIVTATELKLNEPVERELASNETHDYRVMLRAGEFIQVRAEQKGIDVGLIISSSTGTGLAAMNSPNGEEGFETLSFIADDEGTYLLKVRRWQDFKTQSGKYNLTLTAKRPSTAQDRKRIAAEQQFLAIYQLKVENSEDRQLEIKRYEELLPLWQEIEDEYIVGLIVKEVLTAKEREKVARKQAAREEERKKAAERKRIRERATANLPQLVVPLGHDREIACIAISPDQKTLASGSGDGTIKLWDMATGQEIRSLSGHTDFISSVAFSPDGKLLASMEFLASTDGIRIWDVATGQEIRKLDHSSLGNALTFSPDGKLLISGGDDNKIKVWDVATGKKVKTLAGHSDSVNSISLSKDGRLLVSGSEDKTAKLWDTATGSEIRTFTGHTKRVVSVALTPDGRLLASGSEDQTVKLWDVATGQELKTLSGHANDVRAVLFSPNGKILASGSDDNTVKLWDVASGKEIKTFRGHTSFVASLVFSQEGNVLATGSWDKTGKLWDIATGKEIRTFRAHSAAFTSARFLGDGKILATASADETVKLWDIVNGVISRTFIGYTRPVIWQTLSPDAKTLATVDADRTVKLWDVPTGHEIRSFNTRTGRFASVAFSPDGKFLANADGKEITLSLLATGEKVKTLIGHSDLVLAVAFSPDGKTLASSSFDDTITLWDLQTGAETKTLASHYEFVSSLAFSPNGKLLVSGSTTHIYAYDEIFRVWDVDSGKEIDDPNLLEMTAKLSGQMTLAPSGRMVRADTKSNKIILRDVETEDDIATFILLDENDWAVVDPDGRWDASDGAQRLMYYGLSTAEGYEIIDFAQLKGRYYEPNLLQKLLGYNKEPLKDVAQFKDVLLPPAIEAVEPKDPKSTVREVKIRNRNGGIGRLQVFVNGREFIEDARDEKLKANPNLKEYVLSFDLKNAAVVPGQKPDVRVVAWNYDARAKERYQGYISSRGTEIAYTPPEEKIEPPTLYAIIGGVSDYKGEALDLRFAAKDAEDIYKAIQVGGKNLFGVERLKLKLLSTGGNIDAILPTKENFRQAFAEFAREAKPNDILFVYLAGHGITLNFGSDTYYYLTQEAATTNKETISKDSALLASSTINSEELTQWHKNIKAQKQVLILDTCAAGALGSEFKIADKRDLSSDAKRAIENMRDRIGFHVLMGSAADSVSYEASQYGQGLLTYSLLQGMKGAALQPDGQIDVSKLFNYAADTVPTLAKNIGGIQRPEIRVPVGGTSFAFGLIQSDDDKRQIPLATPMPLILRPVLQNQKLGYDNLKLTVLLRDALREASYAVVRGGDSSPLVFVDAEEMPDAIIPSGNYTVEGETVRVTLNLVRNDEVLKSFNVEGPRSDLAGLVKRLVTNFTAATQR